MPQETKMKKSAITFTAGCLVLAGIAAYALGAQKLTPKQARDLALDRITLLEMSMADFNLSEPARERMSRQITKLRTAIQEIALDGEVPKSFEQLAEDSARATDAEFCAKATTDWERKAFCAKTPELAVEWLPNHQGLDCGYPNLECAIEIGLAADRTLRWRERPKEAKP